MPENFEMQADFSIFVRMDRGEIIIYRTADGETRLEVRMESDSVWLTQAQIARLFGVDRTVIVRHVNNIYKSCELEREATCAKIAHVQIEDISHCFSCSDAASLTLIEAIFFLSFPYFTLSSTSGLP